MTFSIVAGDQDADAVGVAVQSKFISVGSVVPFASVDAGAIATQSFANVAYGPDGLSMLRDGATAEECLDVAGDRQGETYTVQGNILENGTTLEAMADAYETTDGGLPERLIAALHAGEAAGGDSRGKQSAALYVVKPEGGYDGGNDRWIDVRVDDHETPISELERVFKLYDVTLLPREEPDEFRELEGESAAAVTETLAELGFYDGTPTETFGEDERDALEAFRGVNNFENHSVAALEDALVRGWGDATDQAGNEAKLVDAIWHGLDRLDRQ
ncbi:hypothetical protein AArcSl_2406 [Halalkaliarchaeum desulfuricum]|uniref:Putative peptidoglycan binding domain-containing protein n=1 Tax=Halalkaliarchaeum desulfuricum TaxID=2055893 RepID=A0A343TLQ6_9EURY|nr:DUF1028 domain-containing protein [Halalkaliarchaeum desulfuricum]AUX10028.1 hypothetical protein AArcSl_2406 [Halalkaliarchaeum desulfuricum]